MSRARALAAWVGTGKQLTANGVLRRADVDPAAAAIGIPIPGWVRTAADIEALHRPWVAAKGAGLLQLDLDRANAGTPASWDPLELWLRGLRSVLRDESKDDRRVGATVMCSLVLACLDSCPTPHELESVVERQLDGMSLDEACAAYQAFRRGMVPVSAAFKLLVEFGAIDSSTSIPALTPLGRWAQPRLVDPGPDPVSPGMSFGSARIHQLKIRLAGSRPPVWRRVLVPADTDLGRLHHVIQTVLSWDDDHLHIFTVDRRGYCDPLFDLDDCEDENDVTLAAVLPRPGLSITYRYDLGDCWDHTITCEKVLDRNADLAYPTCVTGRGDAPVEDWIPDSAHPASIPFDQDRINRDLAALARGPA